MIASAPLSESLLLPLYLLRPWSRSSLAELGQGLALAGGGVNLVFFMRRLFSATVGVDIWNDAWLGQMRFNLVHWIPGH